MSTYDLTRRRRSLPSRRQSGYGILILAALAVVLAIVFGVAYASSQETRTSITVEGKERVCDGSSDGNQECRYLVFTDHGTFQITDSWIFTRWNSSDVYGRLRAGQTYDFEVAGWRIPFLSRYPNILEARASGEPAP